MNKFLIIVLGIFFINSLSLAEIVFKNCDLSPNYGKVSLVVNLEKKQIKFENSFGIFKVLEINERNNTTLSASDNANPEIKELFLIDIKYGVIKATIKPNVIVSQSTKDFLKNKQTVINTICEPNNLYAKEKQQEQGVILNVAMERKITVAKRQCEMTGLKIVTSEEKHENKKCAIAHQIIGLFGVPDILCCKCALHHHLIYAINNDMINRHSYYTRPNRCDFVGFERKVIWARFARGFKLTECSK